MSAQQLERRLNPEDAAFLLMDRPESPMNIGSIAILEGEVDFERFVEHIEARLHLIPRYRQRVVPAPLGLARPTWEDDPEFDIRRHVLLRQLEPPGTDEQLIELATRLYANQLDRGKPLWEINVVHGLSGERSAVVSRVHHCLVDGVGGVEMLMVILDVSPDPSPPPAPEEPWSPRLLPDQASLFVDAIFDEMEERLYRWSALQLGLADYLLGGDPTAVRTIERGLKRALPYFAVPVRRAFFNGPLSPGRQIAVTSFSFQQVRAVRKAVCGTVNDVMLAVLSLAMREYMRRHGESVEGREFRVLTPVNVRREDQHGMLGNHISMLLVELPVYLADPGKVLRVVAERTQKLKDEHAADGIATLGEALLGLPALLVGLLAALPPPPNTVANMVCTNVPGPMIPLYAVGHRLLEHYALAPLGWEMGIGCAVTSYNQRIYVTLQSDADRADDMDVLRAMFDQAYERLCAAAGVEVGAERETEIAAPRRIVAA